MVSTKIVMKKGFDRIADRSGILHSALLAGHREGNQKEKNRTPMVVWLILVFTFVAWVPGPRLFGYELSGISWFVPLLFALFLVIPRAYLVRFPVFIWIPWVVFVLGEWFVSPYHSLQRTAQLLSPLAIGVAVSTYEMNEYDLKRFLGLLKNLIVALIVLVVLKTGIITGSLSKAAALAPEVMTVLLLCTVFGTDYLMGSKEALVWWGILAAIPVIAITRTAIVATALTIPLNLAPMKIRKKILWLVIISILGVIIFYTPRVQSKMFKQGEGEMSDVLSEDFSDSGRFYMWERMRAGVSENPWFGHGTGAGEDLVKKITGGISNYPHNDWLLTEYDYGKVGVVLYALSLFMAVLHALRKARATEGTTKTLFLAGASSFIFYSMMMYTDNIMVYASYFGNLQFTILGLAYAAGRRDKPPRMAKWRIGW